MSQFRQELLDAARELSGQYDAIKNEDRRRLGSLFNASDYPTTLDGMFDLEVSYPPYPRGEGATEPSQRTSRPAPAKKRAFGPTIPAEP
jgi:hypothetical protein